MSFPLTSNTPSPIGAFGSEKALQTQFGAISPLWFAYAGVAGAGVAYWWMTRWIKPFNIEAIATLPELAPIAAPELVEPAPAPVVEVVEPVLAAEAAVVESVIEPPPEPTPPPAKTRAPARKSTPEPLAAKPAAKAAASPSAKIAKTAKTGSKKKGR